MGTPFAAYDGRLDIGPRETANVPAWRAALSDQSNKGRFAAVGMAIEATQTGEVKCEWMLG
jgi:hypothetical protein